MMRHLNVLMEGTEYYDAVFVFPFKKICAHRYSFEIIFIFRCILASRSSKFDLLFDEKQKSQEFDMTNSKYSSAAFELLIRYFYIGTSILKESIPNSLWPEIRTLAELYGAKPLLSYLDYLSDAQRGSSPSLLFHLPRPQIFPKVGPKPRPKLRRNGLSRRQSAPRFEYIGTTTSTHKRPFCFELFPKLYETCTKN